MKKIIYIFLCSCLIYPRLHAQTTAKEWYDKGISLKNKKDYKDAISAFKKAVSLQSSYADALHQLGWCYNEETMYTEAIDALKMEEQANPSDRSHNYFELGYGYKGLKSYDEAMGYFDKALEIDNGYALAYKERGNTWSKKKECEKALSDYGKYMSLVTDIKDAVFYYNKGWCENSLKRFSDAVKSFEKCVSLDDKYSYGFTELGYAYYQLNLNDEAIAKYRVSMALDKEQDYHPIIGIADVYYDNLKNYDSAIVYYEKGIQLQKNSKLAFYRLGWCYNDRGKFSQAIKPLQEAIVLDADYDKARTELGYAYYKLEQYDNALAQFGPIMDKDGADELSRYYSGFCFYKKGNQGDLKKMIDELRRINSSTSLKYMETLNKYVK